MEDKIKVSGLKGRKINLEIEEFRFELTADEAIELLNKLNSSLNREHVHYISPSGYYGFHPHQPPGLSFSGKHDQQIPKPISEYHYNALKKSFERSGRRSDLFRDLSRVLGKEDGEIIAQEILDIIDLELNEKF